MKSVLGKIFFWGSQVLGLLMMLSASAQQTPQSRQVGADGASTIFSFFSTSPENLDGSLIAYVRCLKQPKGDNQLAPAELWVCNRDLSNHRKVTDIAGTTAHNGVEAQWIDNDRIAFFDSNTIRLVSVGSGKDLLKKKLRADGVGHHPFQHKLLYTIHVDDGRGEPGIYELDCNTQQTRLVLSNKQCYQKKLPSYLKPENIDSLAHWRALHCQYSPDGSKIAFRLDVGTGEKSQLLGICNVDGSDLKLRIKALHFMWFDNESIVGHLQLEKDGTRPEEPARRYSLTRWDLDGNVIQEMMTPRGNHLAISPDRTLFASESFYNTNPVVLKLYKSGQPDSPVTIASFDPYDITWGHRFHVNPAFSRDGKRVYYSKPLNKDYNGTFVYEVE